MIQVMLFGLRNTLQPSSVRWKMFCKDIERMDDVFQRLRGVKLNQVPWSVAFKELSSVHAEYVNKAANTEISGPIEKFILYSDISSNNCIGGILSQIQDG